MEITKIEEGDLAAHTPFTFRRESSWITDRYGYRKRDKGRTKHEVVIIGDSNTVGCGSTQRDMLSEVLEERLKVSVYPYAPAGLNTFLKDDRFMDLPPEIVILASVERLIPGLSPLKSSSKILSSRMKNHTKDFSYLLRDLLIENRTTQSIGIVLDRLRKGVMLHYFRASLRRMISPGPQGISSKWVSSRYGPIFFLQGAMANKDVSNEQFDKAIHILKIYDEMLKRKGIRFIFLAIPEKENIYHEYLRTKRPVFLEGLVCELKRMKIETVDTQKAFEEAFQREVLLYNTDDTHWNANAVRITADLLEELIKKK
jgi:hypothetical protein